MARAPTPAPLPLFVIGAPSPEAALLTRVQKLLGAYPLATAAAVRALVQQGRRYAKTQHGSQLRARLAGAPLARRGRLLFEALGLSAVSEAADERAVLTELIDGLVATVCAPSLERTLSMLVLRPPRATPARARSSR